MNKPKLSTSFVNYFVVIQAAAIIVLITCLHYFIVIKDNINVNVNESLNKLNIVNSMSR